MGTARIDCAAAQPDEGATRGSGSVKRAMAICLASSRWPRLSGCSAGYNAAPRQKNKQEGPVIDERWYQRSDAFNALRDQKEEGLLANLRLAGAGWTLQPYSPSRARGVGTPEFNSD